jgi:hypothetical protein
LGLKLHWTKFEITILGRLQNKFQVFLADSAPLCFSSHPASRSNAVAETFIESSFRTPMWPICAATGYLTLTTLPQER